MRWLTLDVIKWGLLIGSLMFGSIQLSSIAMRLRNIDHAITILTIKQIVPDVIEDIQEEFKNE